MPQDQWTQVDEYFNGLFALPDEALDAALDATEKAGLPPINVAPNQGKLLMLLAQIQGARTILEVGTLGGYSTIWLARALPPDGHLITLELEPAHAEVARQNIARAGFADQVEVRVGRAVETMAQLDGPFDLIFLDADKPSNPDYLMLSLGLSRPGTVIIADNVVRNGAVLNADTTDPDVQGIRRLNEMVASEPRLSATAIQTVGSKGYDGLAIIRVS